MRIRAACPYGSQLRIEEIHRFCHLLFVNLDLLVCHNVTSLQSVYRNRCTVKVPGCRSDNAVLFIQIKDT